MAEPILVTGKRISDMELVTVVVGTEKLPTGQAGDLAVTPDQIAQHVITKGDFATQEDLSQVEINLQTQIANTNLELTNQTTQTRALITAETQARISGDSNLQDEVDTTNASVSALSSRVDKAEVDVSELNQALSREVASLVEADRALEVQIVSKAEKDLVQRGIANRVSSDVLAMGGYNVGEVVLLSSGVEVVSKIAQNTNDPNQNMTGWGLVQQAVYESISDLPTKAGDGDLVEVKGFRSGSTKGNGKFVYIAADSSVNNGITVFNGWTRADINGVVTPEMAGAHADDVNSDADAFDTAIQYAHANNLQVHAMGATYYIDREVDILLGTSYGTQGTILKGAGKAKTFIRFAENVDCFNLTNNTQPSFATNCEITDLSFTQTGTAVKTGVALKTAANITNLNVHNLSFFECKQAIKFPEQFYIARLTSLHAQGCTYGFELGREGTTLFLDNLFVTGGGGNADSFAYKIRASYTTVGSLACDDFNGQSYDFQYGQYDIGALGLELLHSKGAFGNISFYQTHYHIENIEIVNANNLTSSDLVIFSGDSSGSIGNIDTINTAATSPAQLFQSINANVDIGGISGATTYAKSTYVDQPNPYGIELQGLRYQRGDMRPFLGLGNSNLPDQLTSHSNPCKQSILFDVYGAGFNYSGYAGAQDWRFLPAPSLGDWAIQRRPDMFGIAATVSLADGGVNSDRTQAQEGVIPLVVFVKPTNPAAGCIYLNTVTSKVEIYSGESWVFLN